MRKTKIICTIGPTTGSYDMLLEMYKAGMNVVRLNMSHGTHESHSKVIKSIKTIIEISAERIDQKTGEVQN